MYEFYYKRGEEVTRLTLIRKKHHYRLEEFQRGYYLGQRNLWLRRAKKSPGWETVNDRSVEVAAAVRQILAVGYKRGDLILPL